MTKREAQDEVPDTDDPAEEPLEVLTDDARWDAELQALVALASTLEPLDPEARKRVTRWAIARYLPAWKLVQW